MIELYFDPDYVYPNYVEEGPSVGNNQYLNLITDEHKSRPNFMAMVEVLTRPAVDTATLAQQLMLTHDLDVAWGAQLDHIGQWVGISRNVQVPLASVYFSFDTAGLGFDYGSWYGPGFAATGLTVLDDNSYRLLLRAKIGANSWDGTAASLLAILNVAFSGTGVSFTVNDTQNMSFSIGHSGGVMSAVNLALLTGGNLLPTPAGVSVIYL